LHTYMHKRPAPPASRVRRFGADDCLCRGRRGGPAARRPTRARAPRPRRPGRGALRHLLQAGFALARPPSGSPFSTPRRPPYSPGYIWLPARL